VIIALVQRVVIGLVYRPCSLERHSVGKTTRLMSVLFYWVGSVNGP